MTTRNVKLALSTGGTLGFFVVLALIAGRFLGVQGSARAILLGVLALLGIGAAFVVFRYLSKTIPDRPPDDAPEREVDDLFSEVHDRLAAAGIGGGNIRQLPVLLVLGPRGSTKTTLVEQGGVSAELLAGEVYRGGEVVSTRRPNVWIADGTLIVEAGDWALEHERRWSRLMRHLRPARLAAVLGRGEQPARLAVICFPCDRLLEGDRSDAVPAAARDMREKLRQLCAELGIRLPVYVLFTRADMIPHFESYVARLTPAEVRGILGATLPVARRVDGGAYAEREAGLLVAHFDRLFRSLALRRPELLHRETDPEARAGIYEFPREFLKVRDSIVAFLVELGRPSPLAATPIVRGFYFTGVRPVVSEESASPEPAGGPVADVAPVGATMVFDRRELHVAQAPPAPASGGRTRRVPQWTFVQRLFRDLLLGDRVARGMTGGGVRVDLLRRALAGAAIALGVVAVVGLIISFVNNGRLQRDVLAAMSEAGSELESGMALPPQPELGRLAALGTEVRRLREYEDSRPWNLGWGLYTGSAMLGPARRLYFDLIEEPLALPARNAILDDLEALEGAGGDAAGGAGGDSIGGAAGGAGGDSIGGAAGDSTGAGATAGVTDYDAIYSALKAYLVATRYPDSSRVEFLAPVMASHRLRGHAPDSALQALVHAQFEVYALELPHGNPYQWVADDELVGVARDYLRSFASEDRLYRQMIASASADAEPIGFNEGVVQASHTIPAAYTRESWRFIRSNLDENLERLLVGEQWVTGGQTFSEADLERYGTVLWDRYVREYTNEWRELLRTAEVGGFGGLRSAAQSLQVLSGNRSPILHLFDLVSGHTDVPSDAVQTAFAPVHVVMPPDTAPEEQRDLIVEANRAYIDALGSLQASVSAAADASGPDRIPALESAVADAGDVRAEVRAFVQAFAAEETARPAEEAVERLLMRPADAVERLADVVPIGVLRGKLASLCKALSPITSSYPFDPGAASEASIEEVDALLKPDEGLLWTFSEDELGDVLTRQGDRFRVRSDADPAPSRAFVEFLNRMAGIARALYSGGGSGPAVEFGLELEPSERLPRIEMNVDSRVGEFARYATQTRRFDWLGRSARSARITGEIDGRETVLLEEDGSPWALFRLFQAARWERAGRGWNVSWRLTDAGLTLTGRLILNAEMPIFDPDSFGNLRCVAR